MTKKLSFDDILSLDWKSVSDESIDLVDAIDSYGDNKDFIIHIGTDAQKSKGKKKANFVICVCIHAAGRGGRVFYVRFKNIPVANLWEKLYNETMLSLSVAQELTQANEEYRDRILVHVDANPDTRYASSDHVKALAGMTVGYGFKHVLKPDSWAASHAADHLVRSKHRR